MTQEGQQRSPAVVVNVLSEDHYTKLVTEHKSAVLVLNFWAEWAQPSLNMNLVVNDLAEKHAASNVKFLNIEAEEVPEISERFDISAVPTFIFLKDGRELQRIDGANARDLTDCVAKYAKSAAVASGTSHSTTAPTTAAARPSVPATSAPTTSPSLASRQPDTSSSTSPADLHARLRSLLNTAPVMLFMKGTPSEPRCGFSRKMIDLLNANEVRYSSFNILADEEVRQGLKEYSDWPTYPQLYINGELVGGLDIVKQLADSGEFASMVPAEPDLNSRLNALTNKDKIMIFIKGSPSEPRCGFSKQLISIFEEHDVKYSYFDILQDDEVRQGLKEFAGWPTYPMVFLKGELIGGLDIIKELIQTGEFEQVLAASK